MNKFLTVVIFFIFNLSIYAQDAQHDKFDIDGEWELIGAKYKINYIFSKNGYYSNRYKDIIVGGKNHFLTGGKYAGRYANWKYETVKNNEFIDFTFIFYIEEEELGRQLGRFKIINNDKLLAIYDLKKELKEYDFSEKNEENIATLKRLQ